jgi:PAS domain S-box-containing protein
MIEDITERRDAEHRLRRSEQRFRRFVENASEILYSLTTDGKLLYVSPLWLPKLGHSAEEVTGRPMTDFIHEEDIDGFLGFFRGVLERGRSNASIEYRALHKDGRFRWHASSGSVYFDEQGEKFFMGVARDISERKRNQEELRAALARREELEGIIHRSPSVVVLWRASEGDGWPVEFVSQNIVQFGYATEEMLSGRLTFADLLHPDDRARVIAEVRAHATHKDREYSQEYRIITRDGATRWIDDRTVVRVDAEGRITHHEGILTDITDRKAIEERDAARSERDLRVAREVQRHLLPHTVPDAPEIDVGSLYVPSGLLGGDYYDYIQITPRRWVFIVADVSGKGAPAALVMAACRTALRVEAPRQPSPAALMRAVNRIIHPDMPEGMFISIVYGLLDLESRELVIARAGHEAPLVVRAADGSAEVPCPSGLAIGLDPGPIFDETLEEETVKLAPGDIVVLYTDGITETRNDADEEYGRERLWGLVGTCRARTAAEITRAVHDALDTYAGAQAQGDDRTLVVLKLRA